MIRPQQDNRHRSIDCRANILVQTTYSFDVGANLHQSTTVVVDNHLLEQTLQTLHSSQGIC
jgi:hypothetical protein